MHRSGTSLTASILAAAGIRMGDDLLPADRRNPLGYFEDRAFLEFHQRMFERVVPREKGHRDWGWTEQESLDQTNLDAFAAEGYAVVEAQRSKGGPWGWKDPRTTVVLDFWRPLVPEALYILVYRYPWDVADSMQRLSAPVFLENPSYALRLWSWYNRHLLKFRKSNPRNTLLLSVNALVKNPAEAVRLFNQRGIDVSAQQVQDIFAAQQFHTTDGEDPLIRVIDLISPETTALLRELDRSADLGSAHLWTAGSGRPTPSTKPSVAVVIPCHDDGEFLSEAVASVERILPGDHELVIVDDGSTLEPTLEILRNLEGAGYRVIHQENAGLGHARNRGIAETTAPLILPLDADNRLRQGSRDAVDLMMREAQIGITYGMRQDFGARESVVDPGELDLVRLLLGNYIDACAVLRRSAFDRADLYDPIPRGWEDWDLWLSAVERGISFQRVPAITFDYRVRPESMSTSLLHLDRGKPTQQYIVQKHQRLYLRMLPELVMQTQSALRVASHASAELADERAKKEFYKVAFEECERYAMSLEAERSARGTEHPLTPLKPGN